MIRKSNFIYALALIFILLYITSCSNSQSKRYDANDLAMHFSGKPAQIEIGGPFVGIEMHNSSPLLNRISFYYPVANSIDLSEDYWKRDQCRIFSIGLKIGDNPQEWIGSKYFPFKLTPYSVIFYDNNQQRNLELSYFFCKNKPAMIIKIEITNNSAEALPFEINTHLELTLKTSHSYKIKEQAHTEFDNIGSTIFANFSDPETAMAQIFVTNAGLKPQRYATNGLDNDSLLQKENMWFDENSSLPHKLISHKNPDRPVASFVYNKKLLPRKKLTIVQIIGSGKKDEGKSLVSYLRKNYQREVHLFEEYILRKSLIEAPIYTGDKTIDFSTHWAKAIIATNFHYINGDFVPMPCPAEYNFYFTHDVLLTDLAVVNSDVSRVKNDLEFIAKHADANNTIPHAYYWKDNRFLTEYADSNNWNHFWFILVSARYLRHSNDIKTLELLYPLIENSLIQALSNKQSDDLIWAYRPDWWDIGKNYGPRAYMTILAIRTIREYIYISSRLEKNISALNDYEKQASSMQTQLNAQLWDEELNYLINYYEDGSKDKHFYIGSILACHFNLLDENKKKAMISTIENSLLDEKVGIYNAFPMDFHQLGDYLKFNGNEMGDPFLYMNGSVWSHGNAWYALALKSIGRQEDALQFVKKIMTIDGIMNSPNGQPAMCECRYTNYKDPNSYGKVDKPQFLWAAGWYLYTLYQLIGVNENEWNISFDPVLYNGQKFSEFEIIIHGKPIKVRVDGEGRYLKKIKYDGQNYPSSVIPENDKLKKSVSFELGHPELPYIAETNSILIDCQYFKKTKILRCNLKAFLSHENKTRIISPWQPKSISIDGSKMKTNWTFSKVNDVYSIDYTYIHPSIENVVNIYF